MYIPRKLICQGILFGVMFNSLSFIFDGFNQGVLLLRSQLIGGIFAYVIMISIRNLSGRIFKKEALGLGDAYLAAMGGVWLGLEGINAALSLAFISAGLFALTARLIGTLKPLQAFPFGPFISGGIWGIWLLGQTWWLQSLEAIMGV